MSRCDERNGVSRGIRLGSMNCAVQHNTIDGQRLVLFTVNQTGGKSDGPERNRGCARAASGHAAAAPLMSDINSRRLVPWSSRRGPILSRRERLCASQQNWLPNVRLGSLADTAFTSRNVSLYPRKRTLVGA